MGKHSNDKHPRYRGEHWLKARLPAQAEPWLHGRKHSIRKRSKGSGAASAELAALLERYPWTWPKRPVYFFSDPHADADAMIASLVASGGIRKTGTRDKDFRLTKAGRKAQFLIGGDCFDKGPSCLRLLRTLKRLSDRGGDLRILAGNHDVRTMLGMRSLLPGQDPMSRHFFIRMGGKAIPLLKEIHEHYVTSGKSHIHIPGSARMPATTLPRQGMVPEIPEGRRETAATAHHQPGNQQAQHQDREVRGTVPRGRTGTGPGVCRRAAVARTVPRSQGRVQLVLPAACAWPCAAAPSCSCTPAWTTMSPG